MAFSPLSAVNYGNYSTTGASMHLRLSVAFCFLSYIVHCILSSFHTLLMAFFFSAVNYGNYSTTGALPMFAFIVSMIVFHIPSFFVCNSCMVHFLLLCIVAWCIYLHSVFICVNDIHIWGFILHLEFFSLYRCLLVCFLHLLHVCI